MDVRFPGYGGAAATAFGSGAAAGVGSAGAPRGPEAGAPGSASATGFQGALKSALHEVSALQNESTTLQRQFQMGAEGVSLEQTMIAMQRSQIAFQSALTVRNRLVAAYTDIMNMPV